MRAALWLLLAGCPSPEESPVALSVDAGPDLQVPVGEPLTLSLGGEGAESAVWTLGDGAVLDGLSVEHTFAEAGNYGVVVTARSASGEERTDALQVTAYLPPAAVPAVSSSPLVLVGDEAVVALKRVDAVVGVELASGERRTLATCDGPRTLSRGDSALFVACEESDELLRIDDAGTVERIALGTGSRPYGVVARADDAWVSLQGTGELVRVSGGAIAERVAVGPDPRALLWLPDGAVWATRFRSDGVGEVYRTDGEPLVVARATGTDSDTKNRGVPNLLDTLVVSPDGGTVLLGAQVDNTDRGAYRDGQDLTFETTLRAILRGFDRQTDASLAAFDRQLDDQGHAGPLLFSPLGDQLFVAHPGSGIVQIFDGWSGAARSTLLDAGIALSGLAVSDDGTRLWTLAAVDRELRGFDLTDTVRNPLPTTTWALVDEQPLTAQEHRGELLFHDATDTRLAKDGYISCATCHPDGRDDGQVWDFTDRGEGLRNTTSLEGRAGTAMGPLHWTGNFDEIQDFEHDIRHAFGGSGLVTDEQFAAEGGSLGTPLAGLSEDLDALAAYVATFDTTPVSPWPDDAVGAALFASSGCADCHAGALFTDSAIDVRHDIGTASEGSGGRLGGAYDGFDTPTLLGAWSTAPYLHDGSALTLEDAIAAHNGVSLDAEQLAAVARYVRSL